MTPWEMIDVVADATGLRKDTVGEMGLVAVGLIWRDLQRPQLRKWTRGELANVLATKDAEAALEIVQYLHERGPRVIAWTDNEVHAGGIGYVTPAAETQAPALTADQWAAEGDRSTPST